MVTYKKLKYNNADIIQVRSALKDANGAQIDTTYVRHAEFNINTSDTTTNVSISSLNLSTGKIPHVVQIYDSLGKEIAADVQITSTQITVNLIGAPTGQTWKGYVTAW